MINSADAANFESSGGDQNHLFQTSESVSGSESEGKKMASQNVSGLDPTSSSQSQNPAAEGQPSKRTLQNRKAQREFRERKASYVKSLEQRIRAYESNEVQGNVELQRAARRLKEENDQLREQVRQLSERLAMLEGGSSAIPAIPPARNPGGRARGAAAAPHASQSSQAPTQALYNQPQGFSNDVSAYEMMSSAPSFPAAPGNAQGYPQYFTQQQHYNSYPQHQPLYGQDQPADVALNPELRRGPAGRDNAPGRPPTTQ